MVDFKKLRESKSAAAPADPVEIFRRLPKPPGINDLYASQSEVLAAWYQRRDEKDLVLKLHTGGGKTLVGLLIGQSTLNEKHEPVIYLSPTVQLVEQTLAKAREYGVPAVPYEKRMDFPDDFLSGKSILVGAYQALFNGMSRFGTRSGNREIVNASTIILDDAHVAFGSVRDSFTLAVDKLKEEEHYAHLTNLFRTDFKDIGRLGSFDDIVGGVDYGVLEVPYWAWKERMPQVQEYLRRIQESHKLSWLLIRDSLEHCHCLISRNSFVITPVFPLVDMLPTFSDCPRRVYMSATIGDDSALIRTFDANPDSVAKPITSRSLAGVSERMILAPELMNLSTDNVFETVQKIATWMAEKKKAGTVVLVPSQQTAQSWTSVATYPETTEAVATAVKALQEGTSRGPFVFANRYDGIDLPGDSCRLLIMSGLPRGMSEYDLYRANVFLGGASINSELAQRIEQGMGRGARGANDYCIVIVTGKDLISWISRSSNLRFLTSSTRAQLEMGSEISRSVADRKDLAETMERCLNRDREWTKYHAETLAEATEAPNVDEDTMRQAALERRAFNLMRDAHYEKAVDKLQSYCDGRPALDRKTRGWLLQLAAHAAHFGNAEEAAQSLQRNAFAANRALPRPKTAAPYEPLTLPGRQAEAIVVRITDYRNRRGYLAEFDELASRLVPEASSNQFEQALADLGNVLGFVGERPEQMDPKGPDVLWLLSSKRALVIEAKSKKKASNALTREEHGQLLHAGEWFKEKYPGLSATLVSVHHNALVSRSTVPGETRALTFEHLQRLLADLRVLLKELCSSVIAESELVVRCERLLGKSKLTPETLPEEYLVQFRSDQA